MSRSGIRISRLLMFAAALCAGLAGGWSSPARVTSSTNIAQPAASVRYVIDPGQSRFMVKAFAGGLFSVFAHDHNIAIRDFSGDVSFVPETLQSASMQMTIKAASLAVTDKVSDKDRREIEGAMRTKVLETDTYPEIVFKSTEVSLTKTGNDQYQAKIFGNLNLHGVTRHGLIYAKVSISGDKLRARGQFPLRQTDYKITPVSVAGGTVKVKDELKFNFDIVAVKQ